MSAAGVKRKRAAPSKFYSVRLGHKPGIYNSWEECQLQIKGFKAASFQSFTSLGEAERFLAGEAVKGTPRKFYAVKSGKVPGIYTDWPSAQAQITDWQKPKHKCFATRAEAERFLEDDHEAKKAKTDAEPAPLGEDGFDSTVVLDPASGQVVKKTPLQAQATKLQASAPAADSVIRVHTDGSSLNNGRKGAFAGIGVYFGPDDERNISEPLPGTRQTNNRAELNAIQRALDALPRDRDCEIITDSKYAIDCVTVWVVNWRKNGWKSSTGKPVENKDLIEAILQKMDQRTKDGGGTKFIWVKGHAQDVGNNAADRLAVNGAREGAQLSKLEAGNG